MKIEDFFCDDLLVIYVQHIRVCDKCFNGTKRLLTELPLLSMMIPEKVKSSLLSMISEIEKEKRK